MTHKSLKDEDLEVYNAILKEKERQEEHLELIASENFVSEAVMEAQGSVLTNKYAEGYPEKRYYGGCVYVDIIEQLAIDRAKSLFNANFVNVQSHSGSQANFAAYFSVLNIGDTVMGMDLSHGGHLTHGSPVNFSGKNFNFIPYTVSESDELIDYEKLLQLAKEHKPKMIVAGASSYSRFIDFKLFREVADEVGAYLMVDMAHIAGLVVAGVHPSPIEYADIITTTTHKTLRGPRGGMILTNSESMSKKINSFVFPGMQGGPLMHVIAAKAVAFKECMTEDYKLYQHQVVKNSKMLSESLQKLGFRIVSGGTDNHLLVIDVGNKGLKGKDCQIALEKANITTNKNIIPFDKESPFITSGVRVGTAAVTTRGMQEAEMKLIAQFICDVLENIQNSNKIESVQKTVQTLCSHFPVYKK